MNWGWGTIRFLSPSNRKVLAFLREYEGEHLLVVVNLSRFVQYVELDLSEYQGMVAVELFGQNEFPAIGELPYLLTLGPHAFYWFSLESRQPTAASVEAAPVCSLPQAQRRAIVGLRMVGFQPRAAGGTHVEAARAVRGDAPDPPRPRPRKCPPPRGVTSADSPAPTAPLVGALA